MVGPGVGVGAEGALSKETCAGVALVEEGILSKDVDDGFGTDAGLGWVLVVAFGVKEGQRSETVTREGGICSKSIGLEVSVGLERAAGTKPTVVVDLGPPVILEGITGAGDEGSVVTVQAGDTVTGVLDSPAAELRVGL